MRHIRIARPVHLLLVLSAVSLCLLGLAAAQPAGANTPAQQPSGRVVVDCIVENVGVNYISNEASIFSRSCTPSTGNIQYFVVVGTDTKKANQLLSIGLTARATGKPVRFLYDASDASGLASPENSRKLLTLGL